MGKVLQRYHFTVLACATFPEMMTKSDVFSPNYAILQAYFFWKLAIDLPFGSIQFTVTNSTTNDNNFFFIINLAFHPRKWACIINSCRDRALYLTLWHPLYIALYFPSRVRLFPGGENERLQPLLLSFESNSLILSAAVAHLDLIPAQDERLEVCELAYALRQGGQCVARAHEGLETNQRQERVGNTSQLVVVKDQRLETRCLWAKPYVRRCVAVTWNTWLITDYVAHRRLNWQVFG